MKKHIEIKRASLKEFFGVLKWILLTYFRLSPLRTTSLLFGRIFRELNGLIYTFFLAKILDEIIFLVQNTNPNLDKLYSLLVTLLIYSVIGTWISRNVYSYGRRSLRNISRYQMERLYYIKLNQLSIQDLESPETTNRLKRAEEWLYDTLYVLEETMSFFASIIVVIVAGLVILNAFPIFLPIAIILAIFRYFPEQKFNKQDFKWQVDNTELKRRARDSSAWLSSSAKSQLEIRINGVYKFLDNKYSSFTDWYTGGLEKIIRRSEITSSFFNFIDELVSVASYAFLYTKVVLGQMTIGNVTFTVRAIDNLSGYLAGLMSSISFLYDFCLKITDLVYVLSLSPAVKDGKIEINKSQIPPSIEFQNVNFKYPQGDKYIFENLNLNIKSGEKVAIVGHNGAGKTTLVKLIARAYTVNSGKIIVNNNDLNSLKIESWYKQIGILFQNYNFYEHLSVKENIYLGNPEAPIDEKRIIEASINADADEFITEFKNGYDQIMTERYEGGITPSGGQQQKIAIARFFYRNAPLAIFDEPTSAIDAVSEYKIFNRIYSFFENKTVIIISHRFSTVRNADRIIVMDHGQIVEEGSHTQLIEKNGVYANAFRLQAEGYRN